MITRTRDPGGAEAPAPTPERPAPRHPGLARTLRVVTALNALALVAHAAAPSRVTDADLFAVVVGWFVVVITAVLVSVGRRLDPARPVPPVIPVGLGRWALRTAPVLLVVLTYWLSVGRGWGEALQLAVVTHVVAVLLPELLGRARAARRTRREADRPADR